ncbi:hypothetical protein AUJ16_03590 [Candidatus Micrarchaeota archaeon CG1_02_60_51]|nr:MAG: hypothetical protein AUJ16_03590 [Candidatus Micrarchaeota archaeon CG1_02_60_51]
MLDTNFLLLPFERRIDVFEGVERLLEEPVQFVVLKECLDEARASRLFKSVEAMVAKKARVVSAGKGKPDDLILSWAKENGAVVCTADARLRIRLKKLGVPVILLKGESRLDFA